MKNYYDNTENNPPNQNIKYFINVIKPTPSTAIELGCGAGRDTVYLIRNGWNVLAIDKNDVQERITNHLTEEELQRFRFSKQKFEEVELEQTNLIVSNFSLSFCDKDKFKELWKKIQKNKKKDRIFCWQFFGSK